MMRCLLGIVCMAVLTGVTVATAEEAGLIAVLESDAGRWEKADACRRLAYLGSAASVPVLANLLADEELAHMARFALEPMPYPEVDAALRAALGSLDGLLLAGVVDSLGARGDREAVPALAGLLDHTEAAVAEAAARSLGRIGSVAAVAALEAALPGASAERRTALSDALLRGAERLVADEERATALRIYDGLRRTAEDPAVRAAALRGALLTRGEAGVPALLALLQAEEYAVFSVALHTAEELPGAATTVALAQVLDDLPVDRRLLVIQMLGLRDDPAAVPALEALALEGEAAVRVAAVRSLVQIGAMASLDVLVGLTADAAEAVAQAARSALAVLPGDEVDALVMSLLDDPDASRRRMAVEWTGQRRMTVALPALIAAASDADTAVRALAVRTLGELAGPAQSSALLDLLERTEQPQDIVRALMAVHGRQPAEGQAAVRQTVVAAFPDLPEKARLALLPMLRSLGGPQALAAVQRAADGSEPALREAAVRTLCEWPTPDAVPGLAERMRSEQDQTLRVLALRGYLRLVQAGDAPADEKAAALGYGLQQAERAGEQSMALAVLGALPGLAALEQVAAYLDDETVGLDAARAAVRIATAIAPPRPAPVRAALQTVARQDADPELAAAAQGLLDEPD